MNSTEKWGETGRNMGGSTEVLVVPENTLNSETYWSKLSLSSNLRFSECQLTSIHCLGARACHCVNKMRRSLV